MALSNVKCRNCGKVSRADEVKLVPIGNMIQEERCPHCIGIVTGKQIGRAHV